MKRRHSSTWWLDRRHPRTQRLYAGLIVGAGVVAAAAAAVKWLLQLVAG